MCIERVYATTKDAATLKKAQLLFQREAEILYKLDHPQIPKFHATFEQDQRLFLVQDYVKGKTFQELLDEKPGTPLINEPEAIQLLAQMLKVLQYLHRQHIIHRDISPDNIVLREKDGVPVLIDFGAVKEVAGLTHPQATRTRIWKSGYSAPEQWQMGKPVRSSDLYSLAVTIVVLLTGQEPDKLFDVAKKIWRWERWVKVSPKLANILNRMLCYDVTDRYQSADEIIPLLPSGNPAAASAVQPSRLSTTKPQATVNVVGTPSPMPTHPDYSWWDRFFAAIGTVTWRMISQLSRLLGRLGWEAIQAIWRWSERFVAGTFKFVIKLLLAIGLGWLVWTSIAQHASDWIPKFDPIPKLKNPLDSLPTFKNPFESLPKIEFPSVPSQPSIAERKQRYKDRLKTLKLDEHCVVGKVDSAFYNNHPELDRKPLSDDQPESLRLEWYDIANNLLNDPAIDTDCSITNRQ